MAKKKAKASGGAKTTTAAGKGSSSNRGRSDMGKSAGKMTTSHGVIRKWAEQRGGQPATIRSTERGGTPGILRIDFPGGRGPELEQVSWDEFFEKFDDEKLAFLYQDKTATGRPSRFCKFVNRASGPRKGR